MVDKILPCSEIGQFGDRRTDRVQKQENVEFRDTRIQGSRSSSEKKDIGHRSVWGFQSSGNEADFWCPFDREERGERAKVLLLVCI